MDERNVINGIVAVAFSELLGFLYPLRFFLLAGVVLILVDLRFGIEAAKARKEKIRKSRAGRRTINKMVDYLCWILLAGALDKAFGVPFDIPLLPALVLLVVYGFEINSCYSNYFEAQGKSVKVNVFKLFEKKMDIIKVEEKEDE